MSSLNKSLPKPSRVAKMSVRPTWMKKLNHCNSSNEVDVNLPTTIPKPQSPLNQNQPSQENSPTTKTNHDSLPSHLPPLGDSCNTNVGHTPSPPQSNMTITRSGMNPEAIEEIVNRRVEEALAAYEVTRAANALEAENQSQNDSDDDNGNGGNENGGNGNGENENSGNENPNENNRDARPVARECTYQDFMNFSSCSNTQL
ncbi:hypothetical protein Tco_0196752 [Tanacetum coccineum]